LQPIGAGAGQHFVDADDVVGVGADAEMEPFFAGDFDEVSMQKRTLSVTQGLVGSVEGSRFVGARNVLVGTDTSGFEGF